MKITIEILSFWRVGTGGTQSRGFDAMCVRDQLGLPYLPGKNLRGLLRDAVRQASDYGWIEGADTLFGTSSDEAVSHPGCLRVESAHLPLSDQRALRDNPALIRFLFQTKRSTAIDAQSGAAQNHSLRFEEVAIPLTLEAEVSEINNAPEGWETMVSTALPLIRQIGSGRTRGLGRCVLTTGGGAS